MKGLLYISGGEKFPWGRGRRPVFQKAETSLDDPSPQGKALQNVLVSLAHADMSVGEHWNFVLSAPDEKTRAKHDITLRVSPIPEQADDKVIAKRVKLEIDKGDGNLAPYDLNEVPLLGTIFQNAHRVWVM